MMDFRENLKDLMPLDRARFDELKNEFRPHYDLMGLKYLREKAGKERDLRELYRDRAPYELLQNADDADATQAVFILTAEGLVFAHNGNWFTVDNFRSLADGWSDKDPDQCIGHKGLGFRSVLDITPSPHVISLNKNGFFGVKFTWALNNGHIQETLNRDPSAKREHAKWTKHGQIVCPIMAIPGFANKNNLGIGADVFTDLVSGKYGAEYSTMFWLPAKDTDIPLKVLDELSPMPMVADNQGRRELVRFLQDEVSLLLPFLSSMRNVRLYESDTLLCEVRVPAKDREQADCVITVEVVGERHFSQSFFQSNYRFPIPFEIRRQPDTPKAVRSIKEAKLILSVRLENNQPVFDEHSTFHVYFPTDEHTGFGFVIHGDFYVKPDRTRLMKSSYNDWLLGCAAEKAANEFLDQLLKNYQPRAVFEALSPSNQPVTNNSGNFREEFSNQLQSKRNPFVPTIYGLMSRDRVSITPTIDTEGFWEAHFGDVVGQVLPNKRSFLSHLEDSRRARAFLRLANVEEIEPEKILDFIEIASASDPLPASWWYECYSHLSNDDMISHLNQSLFQSRKLIPSAEAEVIEVPSDGSLIVCLPPSGDSTALRVPSIFSAVFDFVEADVAALLEEGDDTVKTWIIDRFKLTRFEATELIPRAIRGVVAKLFTGDVEIATGDLINAWLFIKRITDLSPRKIISSDYWHEVGRFPLPVIQTDIDPLDPDYFVPAFLTYWPNGFSGNASSLSKINNIRRIDEKFILELIGASGSDSNEWIEFFESAGVSDHPKILQYKRIVARGQDLYIDEEGLDNFVTKRFTGDRQEDENRAVIGEMTREAIWQAKYLPLQDQDPDYSKLLQKLTLIEGLSLCALKASEEYQAGDENWADRLWELIIELDDLIDQHPDHENVNGFEDEVFISRGRSSSTLTIGAYLYDQLRNNQWLPSTHGPANSAESFTRLITRRLISTGRSDEGLGDALLPYVIANSFKDLALLENLGVEPLDDVESASASALTRALYVLGEKLSSDWGHKEILEVRGRWRLVRGAIQEIYRKLNRIEFNLVSGTKFATHEGENIKFGHTDIYYAEPGSPVELAFQGVLPLFDADRTYAELFKKIGIIQLSPGETVEEIFLAADESIPAESLKDLIVNKLSPYLLAPILAKSEDVVTKRNDLILRRLKVRFEVRVTHNLSVSFTLVENPDIQRNVEYQHFYLQRTLQTISGAVQEASFTLYVTGDNQIEFSKLDADALGETLVPIFMDIPTSEIVSLFPRIASRYQQVGGDSSKMEDYLLHQLGISIEAQQAAWAIVTGEAIEARESPVLVSPPARVIHTEIHDPNHQKKSTEIKKVLDLQKEKIDQKTGTFVETLVRHTGTTEVTRTEPSKVASGIGEITSEQEARGKRGEEEIKRRLQLPGGWEGFTLLKDRREDGCGYDFLCQVGDEEMCIEVKAFLKEGRIFVSHKELQVAAEMQEKYVLVGILDNHQPEYQWVTFILQDPLGLLLSKGEFDVKPKLEVAALQLFELE